MTFCVTEKPDSRGSEFYLRHATAKRGFRGISEASIMDIKDSDEKSERPKPEEISRIELYERMRRRTESDGAEQTGADSAPENPEEESGKTDTQVVVKPDGSRVLMVTMRVGGMETSMSIKLSEPTDMPNGEKGSEMSQDLKTPDVHEAVVESGGIDAEEA